MAEVITIPAGEGHGVQGSIPLSNYTEGYVNYEHGPDGTRLGTFIDGNPRPVNLTHDERKLLIELLAAEEIEHEQKAHVDELVEEIRNPKPKTVKVGHEKRDTRTD